MARFSQRAFPFRLQRYNIFLRFPNFIPSFALQVQILRAFFDFLTNVCPKSCSDYVIDDVRVVWGICEGSKSSLTRLKPFVQRHSQQLCEGWGILASSIPAGCEQYSRWQWEYSSLTRSWSPTIANLIINRSQPRRFPILGSYHSAKAHSLQIGDSCHR